MDNQAELEVLDIPIGCDMRNAVPTRYVSGRLGEKCVRLNSRGWKEITCTMRCDELLYNRADYSVCN